jgi:invasion protein IalB
MSNNTKSISKSLSSLAICGAFGVAMLAGGGEVLAQQAQGKAPTRTWFKVCSKQGDNNICNVQFSVTADTGQLVTAVNLLTVTGKIKRKIFQIAVPSGRFIPSGVAVSIDGTKANKLPYSICLPSRCMAEVPLSAGLIKALKKGGELTLTSTNFQNKKSPIKVSLNGFTAAFDGPPLKRTELQDRQKKLQEELQKKAEAARKKLEDAQKKAKE